MTPQLITAAIDAAMLLISLATKAAAALKQKGELNAADEAALDQKIASITQQPWWKPETTTPPPGP